jgi:hypothetical protein
MADLKLKISFLVTKFQNRKNIAQNGELERWTGGWWNGWADNRQ